MNVEVFVGQGPVQGVAVGPWMSVMSPLMMAPMLSGTAAGVTRIAFSICSVDVPAPMVLHSSVWIQGRSLNRKHLVFL